MQVPSKLADSKTTSTVSSAISLFSPPMMPASATGFSASQMTRLLGFRVNSFSSRVVIFSPSAARRTVMLRPATLFRSKACMG